MVGGLVEESSALGSSAETGDLFILQRELVVVGDLLVDPDWLLGVNHYLFLRLNGNDLCVTVWLETMRIQSKWNSIQNNTSDQVSGLCLVYT